MDIFTDEASDRNDPVISLSGATYIILYIPRAAFDIAISYCAAVSDEFRYAALTPDCISEFT